MSNTLGRNTNKLRPPSWCKPGSDPCGSESTLGFPILLRSHARWLIEPFDPLVRISEYFTLRLNDAQTEWWGESAAAGIRVECELTATGPPDTYDCVLSLFHDDVELDHSTWPDLHIPRACPMKTGLLQNIVAPGLYESAVDLLG